MRAVIVGAGARGLFMAGHLADAGVETVAVEHSEITGKKILITGKGRCNVTNDCDEREFLKNIHTNPKFLYSAIYGFSPADTMAFFENLEVPLKTERGRRVFPVSDRARDIKAALDRHRQGAKITKGDVKEILYDGDTACGVRLSDGRVINADRVVIATGGLSYRGTGSTGDGYKFAKAAGHNVVPTQASLVPLVAKGDECRQMMGLSLRNVKLTLNRNGKKLYSEQGEMLFTHFGLSGPLVLSASCYMDNKQSGYSVSIDLKPALNEETLYKRVCRDFDLLGARKAVNCLEKLLPKSMAPVVLARWGIDLDMSVNQINSAKRRELVKLLKNFVIDIDRKYKIDIAVITAGGVDTREIKPATMESKIKNNLYFVGEVLDVDGYTGGYNLQIAFSTAYARAKDIIKKRGV